MPLIFVASIDNAIASSNGYLLMEQELAGFEAGVFLEGGREMGDGGITQHDGDFRNA